MCTFILDQLGALQVTLKVDISVFFRLFISSLFNMFKATHILAILFLFRIFVVLASTALLNFSIIEQHSQSRYLLCNLAYGPRIGKRLQACNLAYGPRIGKRLKAPAKRLLVSNLLVSYFINISYIFIRHQIWTLLSNLGSQLHKMNGV